MIEGFQQLPGSLELAFLGDAIYELRVREALVHEGGRVRELSRKAVSRVRCSAQSEAYRRVEPLLDEEELSVARRARNAKQTPPKNADPADYQRATALEALVGYLYLAGRTARMDEILRAALDTNDGNEVCPCASSQT